MAYFDNAATSYPKPEEVYSFMDRFYRDHGGSVGRGNYDLRKVLLTRLGACFRICFIALLRK